MIRDHQFIVFGAEHYNPLTVIRTLGIRGIYPNFIAVKNKSRVSSKSKYVHKNHYVETIEEGYSVLLKEYGYSQRYKPFLIVTDDDIQSYLDLKYDELKDQFIFFQAGKSGRVTEFMDKKNILDLAKKHGLKILPTFVTEHGEVPKNLPYPILTKSISPNIGGWKSDVHICNSADDLKKAYEHILSPKVVIQPYLEKKNEDCIDGFSIDKGKQIFAPMAATYNYLLPGYYSPYMTFHSFDDKAMKKSCINMLTEVGFEGIFSIEFLIDKEDNFYFTEINFRNSPWNYAAALLDMPIPILWAKAMLSGRIEESWYKKPIPENFTAMIEPVDYSKRVNGGMIEAADWLIDFKTTQCPFYFDIEDPEPFREMVRNWDVLS